METNLSNLPFVLIRCNMAGCHFGYMLEKREPNGEFIGVTLLKSRRIYSWAGANTLSDLAMNGSTNPKDCKISLPVDKEDFMACEIIYCSENGKNALSAIPIW